jgi:hypothetical protein
MKNERIEKSMRITTPSNFMLILQLNHLLGLLDTTGIVKHHHTFGEWYLWRPTDDEIVDSRRILSLSDLGYGFILFLSACLVSFVCFVCELLVFGLKKLEDLLGVIQFLRVLRSRMHSYHDKW